MTDQITKICLEINELEIRIGTRVLCHPFTVTMSTGETWSILGPNGTGKSSLLETLAGLRLPHAGGITINRQKLSSIKPAKLARLRSFLFQKTEDNFPSTVLETTLTGRHPHVPYLKTETAEDYAIAKQSLVDVDLQGFEDRDILTLSGGERQRVAIATALTQDTPVRLFDEPANHLDLRHQGLILKLIHSQQHLNIVVLHDINQAWRFSTHALLLYDDGNVESGRVEELFQQDRLELLFGCQLRVTELDGERIFMSA